MVGRAVEPLVAEVVDGGDRDPLLRDQSTEARPQRQAHRLEFGGHRPVGDPHVGIAALVVVQAQVGDVPTQQRAGAPDDGGQHLVDAGQRGEVGGRLEQRGQFGLPPAVRRQLLANAERDPFGPIQRLDVRGRQPAARASTTGRSNSTADASLASRSSR